MSPKIHFFSSKIRNFSKIIFFFVSILIFFGRFDNSGSIIYRHVTPCDGAVRGGIGYSCSWIVCTYIYLVPYSTRISSSWIVHIYIWSHLGLITSESQDTLTHSRFHFPLRPKSSSLLLHILTHIYFSCIQCCF